MVVGPLGGFLGMRRLWIAIFVGVAVFFIWTRPDLGPATLGGLSLLNLKIPSLILPASSTAGPATRLPVSGTVAPAAENAELSEIAASVVDISVSKDTRRLLLHKLVAAGLPAAKQLIQVASSPLPEAAGEMRPHSAEEMRVKYERSLRITALEALDKLTPDNPELAEQMEQVALVQRDPMLQFLAQVSVSGIQQGRPGKLVRMIDKIVQ